MRRLPRTLKVGYTAFLVVLLPVYAVEHGWANFLWFSNVALILTCIAVWIESRWLVSMQAVSVVLLETAWILDYVAALLLGDSLIGLTAYMLDDDIPLFVRGLSLYHIALPPLLLWLVHRLGYERRAWMAQTLLAWVVLLATFVLTDPDDNINWAFGLGGGGAGSQQHQIPPALYLALVMIAFPLLVYLPTHLVFRLVFARRAGV
jgi:hypothetical protein